MIDKVITLLLKPITWPFFFLQKILPRDNNIWLFGAGEGYRYADNAKWLYEYILRNNIGIEVVWMTKDLDIYHRLQSEGKPVMMANSITGILKSLRAGVVFLTNKPQDFNANTINGTTQIWLWHGLMMKKIGNDALEFTWSNSNFWKKCYRLFFNLILPEYKYNPDHVINASRFFTPYFSSAFDLTSDQVHITGYPRNDALFEPNKDPFIEHIDQKYENPYKIIYLPTWRDEKYYEGEVFNPFRQYKFSPTDYAKFLEETNSVFLNKGHDFEEGVPLLNEPNSRFINVDINQIEDLYLLLKDVDLLITDYSSVYFDFILTQKPVILAPFDFDRYTTKSRPLYYDYFEEIEGVKAQDWSELLQILKNEEYVALSESAIQKFHKYLDGDSSKRTFRVAKNIVFGS
ncbi:MAG: CDP-glycerol glycerophosphotransferase family protein [Bacteroidota bacterium]